MRLDENGGSNPNYFPNSFDDVTVDETYKEPSWELGNSLAEHYDRNAPGEDDHYTQPGNLYRDVMDAEKKKLLIENIVSEMSGIDGPKRKEIINRQLCHWFRADINLGMQVAKGLGVDMEEAMPKKHEAAMA
jgi:catalase